MVKIFLVGANNMSYQIISDSCCDFTGEEYEKLGEVSVPLSVLWDGVSHSYFSAREALREFYEGMRRGWWRRPPL